MVVNICSRSSLMDEGKIELPGDLTDDQREKEVTEIASTLDDGLRASNGWVCDLARTHPEFIPFIGVDPLILNSEEMEAHVREMAKDRGEGGQGPPHKPRILHVRPEDVWGLEGLR